MGDWNLNPPPIYLWSRADWTARHIATAQEYGHVSKEQDGFNYLKEANHYFYGRSCIQEWTNDYMSKGLHTNLNEMQSEGRSQQIESLPLETHDKAIAFEADDMCIDMEISPINSPNIYADIQSILEDEPPEAWDTRGMVTGEEGFQNLQPSSSFHNLVLESENGRVQTGVSADISQKVEDQFHGHINDMNNGTPTHPGPQPCIQP